MMFFKIQIFAKQMADSRKEGQSGKNGLIPRLNDGAA